MSTVIIPFRAASSGSGRSSASPASVRAAGKAPPRRDWRNEAGYAGLGLLGLRRYRVDPLAALVWLVLIPVSGIAGWYGLFRLAAFLWRLL